MAGIILLEIISIVSFLYSIFFILFSFASIGQVFLVFIWTIIGSYIFGLNHEKSTFHNLTILTVLLPLIFYYDIKSIYFILLTTTFIYLYIKKSLIRGNYGEYTRKLKINYIVYGVLAVLALGSKKIYGLISLSIPFIIIYLLSTIVLVRSIRHLDSGMDMDKIKRINIRYLILVSFISFIVTLEGLRNFIFSIFKTIYVFLVNLLIRILAFPITILLDLARKFVGYLMALAMKNNALGQLLGELGEGLVDTTDMEITEIYYKSTLNITRTLLTVILIYIIYKLIIRVGSREHRGLEYTEEREYIKNTDKKRRRLRREKYPKGLQAQIRYYYRRYLEKLDKRKIEVLKSDTSLDVKEKAMKTYGEENERIRQIYIDSRYGNKDVDKNVVEEMENLTKKL